MFKELDYNQNKEIYKRLKVNLWIFIILKLFLKLKLFKKKLRFQKK